MAWLIRFFRVVPPVPPLVVALFAITSGATSVLIVTDQSRATAALTPVLVLQIFAASSGFIVPARRGYYDLLLTRVGGRIRVLLMHWMASVIPGVSSVFVLACVEMVVTANARPATLSSGTLAALWLVSCIPWAVTTVLLRFAGGLGWVVVLAATMAFLSSNQSDFVRILETSEPSYSSAFVFLVYPMGLAGQHLTPSQLLTVGPGLGAATLAVAAVCAWLHRTDIRLEAAQ